jgi:hypothetical protein
LPVLRAVSTCAPRLDVEISARIWDVVVFEGDSALIRAAVAVFAKFEGRLYGDKAQIMRELAVEGQGPWPLGDVEEFMATMRNIGKVD